MSFAWGEYMELARQLGGDDRESARRTAIGRAYYAVFHAGRRRWAQDHGLPTTRRIEHAPLWEYFRRLPGGARIGEQGRRLLEMRREVDYEAAPVCTARDVERAIAVAGELLRALA